MFRPQALSSFFALLCFLAPSGSHADTVTINPVADTCLFERDPNNNWGTETEIVAGTLNTGERARTLNKFDISAAIPAGSTINSARLNLRCVRVPTGRPPEVPEFALFRVELDWEEGNKNGGGARPGGVAATAGETTWASRFHATTPWTSPGGKLEEDFAEDPSTDEVAVGGVGNYFFDFNGEGIDDLQSMLDSPSGNFGWALLTINEGALKSGRRWASGDHPTEAPKLVIDFTPPAPPPPLEIFDSELDSDTGVLTVSFLAVAGTEYALETRTDLATGDWTQVNNITAGATGATMITTTPPPATRRLFFRIRAL